MFSLAASTTVLALVAAVSAGHGFTHVRRHHVSRAQPPAGWATSYLEPYDTYHARYMADNCENKHNTTFFDSCCHPLLATETLAKNRPACCAVGSTEACPGEVASSAIPSAAPATTKAAVTTSAAPQSTSTDNEDDDDEDCEEDDGDDNQDDNDDDEEDCEDDDESDESSSAVPTSTKAVATTHTTAAAATTTSAAPAKATPAPTTTTAKEETTTAKQETTTAKQQTTTKETTTTKAATTTSTASTPDKTSSSSLVLGGFGTWFTQGGVAGACGTVHSDKDFVVALQTKTYAKGANCGRKIKIIDASNGKSVQGVVADECPTCTNSESVDMSLAMFEALAALSVGEFSIKWQFLD